MKSSESGVCFTAIANLSWDLPWSIAQLSHVAAILENAEFDSDDSPSFASSSDFSSVLYTQWH